MQRYQNVVIDTAGNAIASVAVTVYRAGTTTLASLFSDDAGTPQANPFLTDGNGTLTFYAEDGRYDVKLTKSGFTFGTELYDIQLYSLANEAVNVREAGVRGDGVTDDTVALQAAITAASGKKVFLPTGVYKITSTLNIPSGTTVEGETVSANWFPEWGLWPENGGAKFLWAGAASGLMMHLSNVSNVQLKNLCFDGADIADVTALRYTGVMHSTTNKLYIQNTAIGIDLLATATNWTTFNLFYDTAIIAPHTGIRFTGVDAPARVVTNNRFYDTLIMKVTGYGLNFVKRADNNSFTNTFIDTAHIGAPGRVCIAFNTEGAGAVVNGVYENMFFYLVTATNQIGDEGIVVNAVDLPQVMFPMHMEGVGGIVPALGPDGKLTYFDSVSGIFHVPGISGGTKAANDLHLKSTDDATPGRVYYYGTLTNALASQESTGAANALLGANSPATTPAEPYKWIKFIFSDGQTGYFPVWK